MQLDSTTNKYVRTFRTELRIVVNKNKLDKLYSEFEALKKACKNQ